MKETMLKRIPLMLLLGIQALGGGAITLAHARDAVVAPPGFEARHDARCAILHDELRCALRLCNRSLFSRPSSDSPPPLERLLRSSRRSSIVAVRLDTTGEVRQHDTH